MNARQISDALNLLDEALLDEANALRGREKSRAGRYAWLCAAACLALAVCVGTALLRPRTAALPVLPVDGAVTGGMGFEGYLAYDAGELLSGSPWRETDGLRTLPVYRNPVAFDAAGAPDPETVDLDAMRARALETAERLGIEAEVRDNAPDEAEIAAVREKFGGEIPAGYFDPTEVTACGDGAEITVEADLSVTVFFEPARALPEAYSFCHDAPRAQMEEAGAYLLEQYRTLLDMDDPQVALTGGDYTFDGVQTYGVTVQEGAGGKTERLLGHHFDSASFSCNDAGELWIIRLNKTDLSHRIGDYPVISPGQARELLAQGCCFTSVPSQLPGVEYVRKVELLYLHGKHEAYFMPYYRFLVELPQQAQENGLKTYGAWYVPAVEARYLTGLPAGERGFNE